MSIDTEKAHDKTNTFLWLKEKERNIQEARIRKELPNMIKETPQLT